MRKVQTQTARQTHESRRREALKYLVEIQAFLEQQPGESDKVDWGHAGTMGHYAGELKGMADSIMQRGEYAQIDQKG